MILVFLSGKMEAHSSRVILQKLFKGPKFQTQRKPYISTIKI